METMKFRELLFCLFFFCSLVTNAQTPDLNKYNVVWTAQSQNSSESMPCGGGDIGLNVWVENGEILFYLSRSGAFDENNVFPKFGRVRVKLTPNPFEGGEFRQELKLKEGYVEISGKKEGRSSLVKIWVDVFRPVVHVETESSQPVTVEAIYESWRTSDLEWTKPGQVWASLAFRDAPMKAVIRKDSIGFDDNKVLFYHRNRDESLFDITVKQQGLDSVKDQLWNPLKNLTFGGMMAGENMKPAGTTSGKYADTEFTGWKLQSIKPTRKSHVKVYLHIDNSPLVEAWKKGLNEIEKESTAAAKTAAQKTKNWWNDFWSRSYIAINPEKKMKNLPNGRWDATISFFVTSWDATHTGNIQPNSTADCLHSTRRTLIKTCLLPPITATGAAAHTPRKTSDWSISQCLKAAISTCCHRN
jgi:hypothetical protein